MAKADELFYKLCYGKYISNNNICFNKFDEAGKEMIISFNTNMMSVKVKYYGCTSPNITRKEIEAIYMKMKELGWL